MVQAGVDNAGAHIVEAGSSIEQQGRAKGKGKELAAGASDLWHDDFASFQHRAPCLTCYCCCCCCCTGTGWLACKRQNVGLILQWERTGGLIGCGEG